MTDPTADQPPAAPSDERRRVAEELALLVVLGDRVKAEENARREIIATTWAGGDRVSLELPSDNPARPYKIGTIRADGGQGIARISDRPAWEAWCRENYAHNVTHQPAGRTSTDVDDNLHAAVGAAVAAATMGGGFGFDPARAFLEALERCGYLVGKRQPIPERLAVQPSWEKAVLEASQAAGAPITPNGDVPAGVEFVQPSKIVKPVVTIGKDEATRTAFVTANRHRLPELAGSVIDITEEQ